jgi:hypothetical protein
MDNKDKFVLIKLLIESGANVRTTTPEGKTVIKLLNCAKFRGVDYEEYIETLTLLCKNGANKDDIEIIPWKGLKNVKWAISVESVKNKVQRMLDEDPFPSYSVIKHERPSEGNSLPGSSTQLRDEGREGENLALREGGSRAD